MERLNIFETNKNRRLILIFMKTSHLEPLDVILKHQWLNYRTVLSKIFSFQVIWRNCEIRKVCKECNIRQTVLGKVAMCWFKWFLDKVDWFTNDLNLEAKFVDLRAELENIERDGLTGSALKIVEIEVLDVRNFIPETSD